MAEEKAGWSVLKIAGGLGIAFATAFFALTIRFVSEIRSEMAALEANLEGHRTSANAEIARLRDQFRQDENLDTRNASEFQTEIASLITLIEERTKVADAEIKNLRLFAGVNRERANEALQNTKDTAKRVELVVQKVITILENKYDLSE